jgi:hypothetical protein
MSHEERDEKRRNEEKKRKGNIVVRTLIGLLTCATGIGEYRDRDTMATPYKTHSRFARRVLLRAGTPPLEMWALPHLKRWRQPSTLGDFIFGIFVERSVTQHLTDDRCVKHTSKHQRKANAVHKHTH